MVVWGKQHCCVGRIQDIFLRFRIFQAVLLLQLFLATAGKDQEDFLGRYKAVFKTACEDPWIMSSRISLHPLKEFLVCVDLKLYSSHSPWIAYVYTQETPHVNGSANKYDLGLMGDHGKLTIWLFGNQINKTARLHENTWNQICIQWKSDNEEMKVFIDGKKILNKKLRGKVNLPGKGQFLLGCSKLRGAAASPNQGMTGELYMFRMWDKANITQSEDCQDSGVIGWRKEDWTYTTTVEKDNSLPCVETTATLPGRKQITDSGESAATTISDMSSEETTQSAETLRITDYYSTTAPAGETIVCNITHACNYSVFYVGKVKLKASEESNTSLSVEIINNITTSSQIRKLIAIPASAPQELSISEFNKTLQAVSESSVMECSAENQSIHCNFIMKLAERENISSLTNKVKISQLDQCCCSSPKYCSLTAEELQMYTIQVPPHSIWVPFPHSPSLSKKTSPKSNTFISSTMLSAKQSPTIRPLITPFTETPFSGPLSTSPTTNPLAETSVSSTIVTTTHSFSESVAQPTTPTFSSVASNKSATSSTPATKSVTNAAFSIKPNTAHLSKPFTILSPSVGFTKHSALSSSELPHKLPIVTRHFETITKSVAQIPPATTQLISGNKNISTVPILPFTPFTMSLTPTVSPVNHSVSASRPHSTVDGHGSTGKTPTTNTTSVSTTISITTAEQIVSKIENDLAAGKVEPKDVERMVNEVSSVLTASQPLPPRISKRIIKLVDYIGLKLKLSTSSAEFASPSLALAVVKTHSIRSNEMSFAVQDSADLQISLGAQAVNDLNNLGSITLPSSLLTNLPTEELDLASRIIFNFFKKTTVFQDLSLKNASLISNVISSSVANLTIRNSKANVTVTLQNIKPNQDNSTVRCVFWDFNKNGGHGGWSHEGCIVKESRVNETVCSCNHLTSFAVLMNLYGNTPLNPTQELVLTFISYIGCGLSAIFLSVTLVTYIAFEKIRRDYPSKILIQLCAALLLLNLVFLLDSWIALYDTRGLCIAVAVFLHYFLLVSFTWMGLEAFHMYLALVKVFNTYVRKYILKFCVVGWGLPALVVSIVLAISPDNYGLITTGKVSINGPDEFCWIKNRIVFYITAVGYFCLIFLINISMFIVVLIQLCRIKKKKQLGAQRKTSIQDLRSVAGLTFLLGITWGFAFFTVNEVFTYLFTIFNTLQGFFIFIFYCVTKENVRKQWRRYLCCGKFRLAENSDWSRTATNGLKKQTVNQGVSSSSNSLQSNSNSTNSTTLLMNNDYSVHANGNGHLSSEKNGVLFSVQNGDVCLHDFSGKQLVFQDKDDTGSQESHISFRRTSKRESLNSMEKM
ncbi:adhesion G-protein coupled receptor G2 isoform X1 [Manacus vitellinus]|uniref:adhesion G-protein coupled receptor G2 isoform X1 n=1 Tax=Manacus vitellinus TaxID=328815 RepID=UPI00115DEC91|nr:adhesion G-protein coupled receptor G2 isoform X1 [Manacus vitellinus]XP_029820661.1 adhesion G-protein coupled receptor G2 isoform X1 [Manacus vitellinus]XP_029820662.1 adhesion G-protein coupled receptor G2 isoform X1 [Manacus vitellinus]XP_029820663.1 adhesion G-protein coupled receptor G2 isoform X1 [Manacus vitellinus]